MSRRLLIESQIIQPDAIKTSPKDTMTMMNALAKLLRLTRPLHMFRAALYGIMLCRSALVPPRCSSHPGFGIGNHVSGKVMNVEWPPTS